MSNSKNCSKVRGTGLSQGSILPKNQVFLFITAALIFHACGTSREEKEYLGRSKTVADTVAAYVPSLATDTINGVTHNFIRMADMKFKVKDVLRTTQKIEDLVAANYGYVTLSEMTSDIQAFYSVPVSEDSLKESRRYTTINNLTLRVPNKLLDTVLRSITGMAEFVDFRRLNSDDVKMKLFANHLAEKRNRRYQQRIENKADQNTGKLKQVTEAEDKAFAKQTEADAKKVESYDLADQVNYSTVKLQLYQSPATFFETIAAPPKDVAYESPFGNKLLDAFLRGFEFIKKFILFLVDSWGVLLIAFAIFLSAKKLYEYYNRKTIVK